MKLISSDLINQTIDNAREFERKRSVYRFHERDEDKVQRMLNAIEPQSYVAPHKHEDPDKVEVFIGLLGKLLALEFDDQGKLINHQVFGPSQETRGVEFAPRAWHCVWSLEERSVAYEVIEGPYNDNDHKHFAAFAPKEEEKERAQSYMLEIKKSLGL